MVNSTGSTYSRLTNQQQSTDSYFDQDDELDAAFNEPTQENNKSDCSSSTEDEDDEEDERHRLVPHQPSTSSSSSKHTPTNTNETNQRTYDFEPDSSSTRFYSGGAPTETNTIGPPMLMNLIGKGGGIQNDGVFANLSAKPDGPGTRLNSSTGQMEFVGGNDDGSGPNDKEDILPTYDSAALDSAPPYWETTVTLPGVNSGPYGLLGPDDVLVDGLPVGNLFGFAWNLLVSMSFQFIGFLLTYLLHTTHAGKNGSRAGLGITLIQYGLYTRTRALEIGAGLDPSRGGTSYNSSSSSIPQTTTDPWGLFGPTSGNDWDGSTDRPNKGASNLPYDGVPNPGHHANVSGAANEWLGYILIAVGWFLLLGGLFNYWRAVRWARAVRSEEMMYVLVHQHV
ncbi:hypothetical protein KEM48_009114 [Puccinia striiformis f. sp. tritici PST-130]|nr:hypothetical protein KEM48_009114 [Puccinia striiformis f. sp. tritici PST-130]